MTEGNSKEFEMAVGTSSVLESGMMEGENFYTPMESTNETETASQSDWNGGKPPDTGQLCRSCANTSDYLIPIYEGEGLEHQLEYKIQKHLPIQVSSTDTLPLQLCYQCASTLIAWDTMISSCLEAEKKLKAMQEALEECKNRELYEDSHVEGDAEMVDSDDEPLITSKTKLLSEKNKATPIKKKILSKAKGKIVTIKNDKTATNSKEEEEGEEEEEEEEDRERLEEQDEMENVNELEEPTDSDEKPEEEVKSDETLEKRIIVCQDDEGPTENTAYTVFEIEYVEISDKEDSKSKEEIKCVMRDLSGNLVQLKIDEENESSQPSTSSKPKEIIKCPLCEKTITRSFSIHLRTDHKNNFDKTNSTTCNLCGKTIASLHSYIRHIKLVHEKLKEFICDTCGRCFGEKSKLKEHFRIHTMEYPFECKTCGKRVRTTGSLRSHQKLHYDSKVLKCEYCDEKFRFNQQRIHHTRRHHTKEKPFACDLCDRRFEVKQELKRHLFVHTSVNRFECNYCGRKFKQKRYLLNHLKSHPELLLVFNQT